MLVAGTETDASVSEDGAGNEVAGARAPGPGSVEGVSLGVGVHAAAPMTNASANPASLRRLNRWGSALRVVNRAHGAMKGDYTTGGAGRTPVLGDALEMASVPKLYLLV